jgi:hypothetical protein
VSVLPWGYSYNTAALRTPELALETFASCSVISLVKEGKWPQTASPASSPSANGAATNTEQAPAELTWQELHGKAWLVTTTRQESKATVQPPASLTWLSAQSVPPGKAKRSQTCLLRRMIHCLDSSTLGLTEVWCCLETAGVPAPAETLAGSCIVSRATPSFTGITSKAVFSHKHPGKGSQKPHQKELNRGGGNQAPGDSGSTPSWYRRGNQS